MLRSVALLACLAWASVASAQTDPLKQPLLQTGSLVYVGQFTVPDTDGTGWQTANQFTWSWIGVAGVAGPSRLYFACHAQVNATLGIVEVPSIGGVAKVIEPCRQMPNFSALGTDPSTKHIGGAWNFNGRHVVDAYIYYDGGMSQVKTHWFGSSLTSMSDPVLVQAQNIKLGADQHYPRPGMMAGWMGPIPAEWQALVGGPAFVGQGGLAVTARTSFGPALSVFDPAKLGTADPLPATLLMGYPEEHQGLGAWGPTGGAWRMTASPYYSGADMVAGVIWPSGTRSVLSIGRHGTGLPEMNGDVCYGPGTGNVALIDQSDGQGNRYCYDPSDSNKGPHAYRYVPQAMAFDANDLAAVKAGTKQPWDVKPYAVWNFGVGSPLDKPGIKINGATYDPSSQRLYVTAGWTDVFVFDVKTGAPPPPPPIDCQGVWSEALSEPTPLVCDATQIQRRTRTKTFTITTAPANGGAACPASPVVTTETSACEWTPPEEICGDGIDNDGDGLIDEGCTVTRDIVCTVAGTPAAYADKDAKLTVRCNTNGTYSFRRGQTFTVTVPKP